MTSRPDPVGTLLRRWRQRRRLSQMTLALDTDISTRHLSYLETGRARPSRAMLLRLSEQLDVPLRGRNQLLLAAGFAPQFTERPLSDPALTPVRTALEQLLVGLTPLPALVLDRHWQIVSATPAVTALLDGVHAALLAPPVNVLRLSLHPDGLAPRILNLTQWRAHLLARLAAQIECTNDPVLLTLQSELLNYPLPSAPPPAPEDALPNPLVTMRLTTPAGPMTLLSTTLTFAGPLDVTVSELSLEAFFPADAASAALLTHLGTAGFPFAGPHSG